MRMQTAHQFVARNYTLKVLVAAAYNLTPRVHREQKELAIYVLRAGKNGSKMKESSVSPGATPEGPPPLVFVLSPEGVHLPARNATMAELAWVMQRSALDRPVVDKTGLSGRFDFDLEWTPDDTQFDGNAVRVTGAADSGKSALFSALQQLGLRLEATRGPISALVVDHAEKPDDN